MTHIKILLGLLLIVCSTNIFCQSYKDPNTEIEARIFDLLSKMSLDEKIGQMQQKAIRNLDNALLDEVKNGKVGSFLNAGKLEEKAKVQKVAIENSRLGIPLIFGRDVIHGYKTILPIPLGQAATWNPEIIEIGAKIAAREAAEDGIHWTFAPVIDITRDPRWGRIAESCGEDPILSGVIGSAMIRGFQGNDLKSANTIAASAKHYVGYGAAEGGKEYNTTLIPERELRDIYLKPFQMAVKSGVATLMCGFNDLNGVPTSANRFTLRKILREEWNFNGFVVSDWTSIEELKVHGFAKDGSEAALKAANAGVNMEMVSQNYYENLKKHIESGDLDIKWLDELVAGILRIKFKLGLFENPYTREFLESKTLSDEHKEIAKQLAIESVVLLKNKNNILPLNSGIKKIAIIGPLANAPRDQLGTWAGDGNPEYAITPLTAINNQYGNSINIIYAKGLETPRSTDQNLFAGAIEALEDADAGILFLGEDQMLSGEAHSRAFINLPGAQEELVKVLSKIGKPLVLVIMAGRPLTFSNIVDSVNSILYAWHPGTMGGPALADIIFGKVSPSGKLPVTFPRTVGQIPLYYNKKNTGRPPAKNQITQKLGTPENPVGFASFYLDVDYTPAYDFGYGLSYTNFSYSNLKISKEVLTIEDSLEITVKVTNTGNFKAKETVQLYLRDLFGSVTRPIKELKSFKKITFNPGETREIKFIITSEDLKFTDINMLHNAEAGEFELFVGSSSNDEDLLKTNFSLIE